MPSKYTLDEDQQLALAIAASLDEMEVVKPSARVSPAQAARRAIKMEPDDTTESKGCVVCTTEARLMYPACLHPICCDCHASWTKARGPNATCPICRTIIGRLTPPSGSGSSAPARPAPAAPVQRCKAGGACARPPSTDDESDSESESGSESASDSSDCADFYFLDSDSEVDQARKPATKAKAPKAKKARTPPPKKAKVARTPGEPVYVRGYYVESHVRAAPSRKGK
jgi:hypothetical protein